MGGLKEKVSWLKSLPIYGNYLEFVPIFLQQAQQFDFAIAPLEDNEFNVTKSYIKFLDYSAAGLAGIYSRAGQYSEIVQDKINGLLVENTTEAWYQAIKYMIHHPEHRQQMAYQAYEDVDKHHRLSASIESYFDLLASLIK